MPVIDKVKECEEQQYCDKGRQMWDPRTNPGGPSPKARPVCQVQGAKYFWPKIHGETRPMKPVVMAALRNGYVEGCVLDDPERPGDFRAYLCLTYRGRDAWARYCSMRRMRWRERIYYTGDSYAADRQVRPRDPRTEWSSYPPEHPQRVGARDSDVTYG